MSDQGVAGATSPDLVAPRSLTPPWPGRRLALLFLAAAILVVAHAEDILGRFLALQATWPPPPFEGSQWAHPDPVGFASVGLRVLILTLLAALPAFAVLAVIGRRNQVAGSVVLTGVFTGLIVLALLGSVVPQLVRAIVGMAGPDGRADNPATYLVAPVVEELLKLLAVVLVFMVTRPRAGARSGLIVGAAVGLGVTIGETVGYALVELVQRDDADVLLTVAARFALLGAGLHVSTAALSGAGFGTWLAHRGRGHRGTLALAGAVALAMLTHAAWNRLATDLGNAVLAQVGQAGALVPVLFAVSSMVAVPFLALTWAVLAVAWWHAGQRTLARQS